MSCLWTTYIKSIQFWVRIVYPISFIWACVSTLKYNILFYRSTYSVSWENVLKELDATEQSLSNGRLIGSRLLVELDGRKPKRWAEDYETEMAIRLGKQCNQMCIKNC